MTELQGRLGPGVLAHLLQYLAQHDAVGRLSVHHDGARAGGSGARDAVPLVEVGRVYLGRGRILHADLGGTTGVLALAQMLEWVHGRFAFQVGIVAPATTVDLPVDRLLLSMSVEQDRRSWIDPPEPGRNGRFKATPLVDPKVAQGLVWAAVVGAGPIGEIFVAEAFEAVGHNPHLLPVDRLGALVQEVARHFKSAQARQGFLTRAEAVLAHHGYGRVEG